VTGFVVALADAPGSAIYFSGDTVWLDGVAEVAQRFPIRAAVRFMGAARVPVVGPFALTMTAEDGVQAAHFRRRRSCPSTLRAGSTLVNRAK
jgi:hypothetical protein